jgi:AcrR family transcriptional regulator
VGFARASDEGNSGMSVAGFHGDSAGDAHGWCYRRDAVASLTGDREDAVTRGSRQEQNEPLGMTERTLPDTAERIVKAAKRVLARRGYSGLTLKAISEEAGTNQALVSYYFGGKAGLLDVVVDSLFEDTGIHPNRRVGCTRSGPSGVHWLIQLQRRASSNRRVNRLQFELLPHALRTKRLRTRFSELYQQHRAFDAECLTSGGPLLDMKTVAHLAALSVAVVDGLAVQLAVDPDHFDHDGAYAVWESMLLSYIDAASNTPASSPGWRPSSHAEKDRQSSP